MTTDQLSRALAETLDAVVPPAPDLAAVRTRGRRLRRRRRTTVAAVTVGAVAASWIGAYQLADRAAEVIRPQTEVAVPGGFDTTNGLRAVFSPGVRLFLGDTSVDISGEEFFFLDTDGAMSSYGVLYTDEQGAVTLLEPDGKARTLTEPGRVPADAHPTIKVDPASDLAAWMTYDDGEPTLEVYDLAADEPVASTAPMCLGDCDALVIDAISDGRVLLRGDEATVAWTWESPDQEWMPLAGPATRFADVQNGVALYDGGRPTRLPEGWRAVRGPVDGLLTHDGAHVVAWDRVLPSTLPGGEPIRLEDVGAVFFTVDTDGSVLAAGLDPRAAYDCDLVTGACERYADLPPQGGDPQFPGTDM
jgi:hypothetical protein